MANEQKKFLVLFLIPVAVMDGWAKTDPTEKKAAEDKLKGEWDAWMKERAAMILSTEAAGKTKRVTAAGVRVIESRLTRLAYAPEIAQAMLRVQQANAVVAARHRIVEGAVGMVELALDRLSADAVVELDEERKATMVGNLLVVLCSDHDLQPVVNAGSLY